VKKSQLLLILFFLNFILIIVFFVSKIYFQPIAIVVPHHNIVKEKRLEFFKTIAQKRPLTRKIIIISPNHFSPDQFRLNYANIDWSEPNGSLQFSSDLESQLKSFMVLSNGMLQNDHGIFNLLPDIKSVWPNAKVFPILIGQNYPVSKLNDFIQKLNQVCQSDCLLISSVDFSHYLPSALANIHDQKSIYDLATQNLSEIPKLEVDSPQSLYILAKFSQIKNAKKWNLFYHSNSGELYNNPDIETTSHVFGSYQRSIKSNNISSVKTGIISSGINKIKSINSLGIRFFYGTDFTNLDYSSTSLYKLPFQLPKNIVVSVVTVGQQSVFNLFPIEVKNDATYLLRGESKINQINLFLKTLKLNSNCLVNPTNLSITCIN
jgi:AmmeMemoRadiSam system protein B